MVLTCEIKQWTPDLLSWVHNRVHMTAYSVIDLFSFASGTPHEFIIDTVTFPDGSEKSLVIHNPNLASLCTFAAPKDGKMNLGDSLGVMLQNPNVYQCMRDLIRGVAQPNSAVIDCARAIEGIRYSFDPNPSKRGSGWGKMQTALNVEQSYREYITNTSTNPRHGDKSFIPGDTVEEVTRRSWEIMNRFMEYMLRGKQQLPLSEFRLLK